MKRLVLALVTAAALGLPVVSAHANQNGTKQNGVCQNGYYSTTLGHCVNNK